MHDSAHEPELLAKSAATGRPAVPLARHLFETRYAGIGIFRPEGRWGRRWRRFFRLKGAEASARFMRNLEIACLLHDIGKANAEFQALVRGQDLQQVLRHEHLSTLLIHHAPVWSWLSASDAIDPPLIAAAVLAHHLKAAMRPDLGVETWALPRDGGRSRHLTIYPGHPELRPVFEAVAAIAGLPAPPALPAETIWRSDAGDWLAARMAGERANTALLRQHRRDPALQAMLLAVKAGLLAADAAGSGLVRTGRTMDDWLAENVHTAPLAPGEIAATIMAPRGARIAERTGRPFVLAPFQEAAGGIGDRGLLLAACGAGKTLAAWRWADAVARRHEIGKVIFLYPTRGTATEGFRDYVGWAPETEAELLTGTAAYELEGMATNPSDATEGKTFRSEADERLFALGFWRKRYFSATVDQFLGFMEHQFAGLCMVPALADAAVIIDEVHSFDPKMFGVLKGFLQRFDVPVLCMTATLSPRRRQDLVDCGLTPYPSEADRTELDSLVQQERAPRYAIEASSDEEAAFAIACAAFREGLRVLCVVNTVARCQALADRLAAALVTDVLTYHSRYRLTDRQAVHQATVGAFAWSATAKPAIAVTTQVCEMSLDLDVDVLLTELAPISSLVQRMGRANRHRRRERARVIVYPAPSERPYTRDEIQAGQAFLAAVAGPDVSQADLAETLEQLSPPVPSARQLGRFLDEAYGATPGSFREDDGFTLPAVLDADAPEVLARLKRLRPIDGFVLQAPAAATRGMPRPPGLPPWLHVVPAAQYRPDRGFRS